MKTQLLAKLSSILQNSECIAGKVISIDTEQVSVEEKIWVFCVTRVD